ncbi:L-fucose mutarotase [Aerococcaceae bacterium zg-ZJ1578]|uniref:L-fucose mutarotase n=1 Tax=Aerococcaceae TaxID=186827 RepID=UPI0013B7481D|nr:MULTISPECIES: L-fucose mutarotase [unclassified Facklamia]MBK0347622.1 L-fucose mutarotase [Aerococcaceae bacterium zg-1578]MBR7927376.1 L-fucose mutarotase [Aerococcaceae bacterium zg-ZUI334]MBS4461421.1 L-fucose mutarotase [Aerococcaceae bacterium zg-B36]QQD65812.1 L-fucose mutarotase [Aerococcaceae bacterium zg-252]NEW64106.1 L-fucose mutarotase [Facklamia sp. 252]
MLKQIPKILSPELVKLLMEMGHGDEIVLSDANYPAHRLGQRVVRADGHGVPELLDAILQLFPLDTYSDYQVGLMQVVPGDNVVPVIWDTYKEIIAKHHENASIKEIERFAFYEQSKEAYAVLITGETALYGNVILKKGVI